MTRLPGNLRSSLFTLGLVLSAVPLVGTAAATTPSNVPASMVVVPPSTSSMDRSLNITEGHTTKTAEPSAAATTSDNGDSSEDAIMDSILDNKTPAPIDDRYYTYNHAMYTFNSKLDKYIFKPVAKAYVFILPTFVRTGITNFFNNISEPPVIINDVLQGNIYQGLADTWRLVLNSTIGIGGLFDVAKTTGLLPHQNDLGITFAVWWGDEATYFVLPVLGPSTTRDALALPINTFMTVWPYVPWFVGYPAFALDITSIRANQLPADPILQQLSIDPYVFLRDAYMQHRNYQIQVERQLTPLTDPFVITDHLDKSTTPKRPQDKIPIGGAVGQALLQ